MTATRTLADAEPIIASGGIGVILTDTLYGVIASALDEKAVERVYELKDRREHKPCIILIPSIGSLAQFGIPLDKTLVDTLSRVWPGKISIIIPSVNPLFTYLDRGTKTLAFRVPDKKEVREFLEHAGPVIAPSANPEGKTPARDTDEARKYFKDKVDFYVEGGEADAKPSTLARYENGRLIVLREGAVKL